MPLFEYQCKACGHKFEELVANAETSAPCPKCSSSDTAKQLSVFAASAGASGSAAPSCASPGCGSSGFG